MSPSELADVQLVAANTARRGVRAPYGQGDHPSDGATVGPGRERGHVTASSRAVS